MTPAASKSETPSNLGRSWWLREALARPEFEGEPARPLASDTTADVVILGGGYTGMWTAWSLKERDPGIDVVLLEQDICGGGPSGRNGGLRRRVARQRRRPDRDLRRGRREGAGRRRRAERRRDRGVVPHERRRRVVPQGRRPRGRDEPTRRSAAGAPRSRPPTGWDSPTGSRALGRRGAGPVRRSPRSQAGCSSPTPPPCSPPASRAVSAARCSPEGSGSTRERR